MSIFEYGPLVPFFAWRPVKTIDAGWVWLRHITRRRQYLSPHISGPGGPWWQYQRFPHPSRLAAVGNQQTTYTEGGK